MPSPVRDNTARSRFELQAHGVTAFMNYRLDGDAISFDHTETPVAARGLKIVPRCPFVRAFIDKHPEYRELVA